MKVEIWSDFVCPFCYIGKEKLEQALAQFPNKDSIEVEFRSFELDPNAPSDSRPKTIDMLSAKYGVSKEQAVAMNRNVSEQAGTVGLTFNLEESLVTNTFDAHRLSQYAATQGKAQAKALNERLFQAYFTNKEDIGSRDKLIEIAVAAGLDEDAVKEQLASNNFADKVRADEAEASQLGVRGVPFFVVDRKYAVSGAQPSEVFLDVLGKAWSEKHPAFIQVEGGGDDTVCTDGVCAPKPSAE